MLGLKEIKELAELAQRDLKVIVKLLQEIKELLKKQGGS
jgi:hypothetical protein